MNPYILKKPVITEKSLRLAEKENKYTFEVVQSATKNQVVAAVEELFKVTVLGVRTIKLQPSSRRTGKKRVEVKNGKTKKAIVKLEANQTIDLFDISGTASEA